MKIHRYAVGLLICLAFQTQGVFGDTQAFVKTDSLHVRNQPAAEAESIGGLKKNDRILVEKNLGEWLQISFEGGKGYIASRMTDLSDIKALGQTAPIKALKVGDPQISIAAGESLTYYERAKEYALISKNSRLYYVHTSLLNLPEVKSPEVKNPEVKNPGMQKDQQEKTVEGKEPSSLPANTAATSSENPMSAEEQALFALTELEIATSPVFEEAESSLFAAPIPSKEEDPTAGAEPSTSAEIRPAEKINLPPAEVKIIEKTEEPPAKTETISQANKGGKESAKEEIEVAPKMETTSKTAEKPLEDTVAPVTRSIRIPINGASADLSDPLMQRAFSVLGAPYVYGSRGPEAFDCSGFTYYVFGQEGRKIPRTSEDQSKSGSPVNYNDLQPGDLLFFDTRSSIRLEDITDRADPTSAPVLQPSKVTHVGIYIGDGKMIHASSSQRKVIIAEVTTGYFSQRLVVARRY